MTDRKAKAGGFGFVLSHPRRKERPRMGHPGRLSISYFSIITQIRSISLESDLKKWNYAVDTISLEPGVPRGMELFTDNSDILLQCALDQWGEIGFELVSVLATDSFHVRAVFKKLDSSE
jgi:hypothetical protein